MAALVDGWRLVSRIRSGGMAEVYLAERAGRRAAVKRLLAHLEARERFAAGLREEARIGLGLRHPQVVRTRGLVEEDGRGHLFMDLVDGPDLASLASRGRPPLGVAAAVLAQAALGLAYVHAEGWVHGDVTPANLLVATAGPSVGAVKLGDFGLARAAGAPSLSPVAGSPAYLAPEQIERGMASAGDDRSDVFALGACAWELLAGRSLFAAGSTEETLARVLRGAPRLAAIRPSLPPALGALVDAALDRSPSRRPPAIALARGLSVHADAAGLRAWLLALAGPAPQPALSTPTITDVHAL
jgi:serine/threonine-protein kinase